MTVFSMVQILLVEDNPADVFLVREATHDSADLVIAQDGEEALRLLSESTFKPDFIMLDLNLPKYNGYTILERHRAAAPVVVFSGLSDEADKRKALALGAREFVAKSSSLGEFMSAVQGILERWSPGASARAVDAF